MNICWKFACICKIKILRFIFIYNAIIVWQFFGRYSSNTVLMRDYVEKQLEHARNVGTSWINFIHE